MNLFDNYKLLCLFLAIGSMYTTPCLQSKFYGSQFSERPGMAKLLAEESDRHWEEGMDVLKKYLQIGGTTDGVFPTSMNFKVEVS